MRSKRIEETIKGMQEKSEEKKMEVCITFQMSVVFLLILLQDSSNPISDAAAAGRLRISPKTQVTKEILMFQSFNFSLSCRLRKMTGSILGEPYNPRPGALPNVVTHQRLDIESHAVVPLGAILVDLDATTLLILELLSE